MDAAHIIWGAILGHCWCITRQVVKSAYGRKRFNILGALDSSTNEVITVSNDTYITATEVVELFKQLREINTEEKEIHVILDNAKYQKCNIVFEAALIYKIKLRYLPSYSPNLNLIERLWKFLRSECLNNKYYLTYDLFKENIIDCLSKTTTNHEVVLRSWLSHKFEVFKYDDSGRLTRE